MKTILAPIDYSKASNAALFYAGYLAAAINAKLIILHVYDEPATDGVPVIIPPAVLEKDNRKRIEKIQKLLTAKLNKNIKAESVIRQGFADEQILHTAKEKKADLIVMGITGAGAIMKVFIGSCMLSVIKKSKIPVLVVPEKAKYHKTAKIVYACDFEKIEDHSVLEPLKEMALLFNSEVLILNILNNKATVPPIEGATEGIELEHLFGNIKHSYWFSEEPDIIDAVNNFINKHGAKMIAMFARKHFFPENITHRKTTGRMALHTHVPFLSMHE